MPIYLCQPGTSANEPWRHGVQVYERPFPMPDDTDNQNSNNAPSSTNTAGTQTTPPNTTPPNTTAHTTTNNTARGPEQIVVMIKLPPTQLINAPSQSSAQSIAIDNEKIIALKRYLTEFISNPTDRVLIFCNNNGKNSDWDDKDCKADVIAARLKQMNYVEHQQRMPLGGLGVVSERDILPNCVSASTIGVDRFLNTEGDALSTLGPLSTLIVDNGAGKFSQLYSL